MGVLTIDRLARIELDDELLDHVFAVVVAKLRRHEPVVLRWMDPNGHPEQVFVNPTCAVFAAWEVEERPPLERDRLERLMIAANSTGGISLEAAADEHDAGRIPTAEPAHFARAGGGSIPGGR